MVFFQNEFQKCTRGLKLRPKAFSVGITYKFLIFSFQFKLLQIVFLHAAPPHAIEEKPPEEIPLKHSGVRAFTPEYGYLHPKYGYLRLNLQNIHGSEFRFSGPLGWLGLTGIYARVREVTPEARVFTPEYGHLRLNLQHS